MATATVNDAVIADTTDTVVVEGNHYFPLDAITATLEPTDRTTHCPWKGDASYYDVVLGDTRLENAAWYYPNPKDAAAEIKDRVAFYPVVSVRG